MCERNLAEAAVLGSRVRMLVDAVSPVARDAALDNNPGPTPHPETLGRRKLDTGEGRV